MFMDRYQSIFILPCFHENVNRMNLQGERIGILMTTNPTNRACRALLSTMIPGNYPAFTRTARTFAAAVLIGKRGYNTPLFRANRISGSQSKKEEEKNEAPY
jgi:hypothetical protein